MSGGAEAQALPCCRLGRLARRRRRRRGRRAPWVGWELCLTLEAEGAGVRGAFQRGHSGGGPACSGGSGDGCWCAAGTVPEIPAPPPPSDAGGPSPSYPVTVNRNTKQFISSLFESLLKTDRGDVTTSEGGLPVRASGLSRAARLPASPRGARKPAGASSCYRETFKNKKCFSRAGLRLRNRQPSPGDPSHLDGSSFSAEAARPRSSV